MSDSGNIIKMAARKKFRIQMVCMQKIARKILTKSELKLFLLIFRVHNSCPNFLLPCIMLSYWLEVFFSQNSGHRRIRNQREVQIFSMPNILQASKQPRP